jgi:hypothetical protein
MHEVVITPDELLARAKAFIDRGEDALRAAAEDIAAARDRGKSQREIAQAVGRSVAWVNRLMRWHRDGFKETPFGPQSRASRRRAQLAVQSAERAGGRPSSTYEDCFVEADDDCTNDNAHAEAEFYADLCDDAHRASSTRNAGNGLSRYSESWAPTLSRSGVLRRPWLNSIAANSG